MTLTVILQIITTIFPFFYHPPQPAIPIPVRIVIGQSNASGALFSDDLPEDLQGPIVSDDAAAMIWTGSEFEIMEPTVNTAPLDSLSDRFGIETLAAKRHVDAGRDVYVIKVSRAGAAILERSGADFETNLNDELNDWIRDGLAALPKDKIYDIQVLWFQGEAESNTNANNPGPEGDAAIYSQSFENIIYNVVNQFASDVQWYDVRMHDGLPEAQYPTLSTLQEQKDVVAADYPNIEQIDGNLLSYQADQIHVDLAGFETLLTLIGDF